MDEVSISSETLISELKNGKIKNYTISPEQFGLKKVDIQHLQILEPEQNVKVALKVLEVEDGPVRDIVLLNSACAIYAADGADSIAEALIMAKTSLTKGKAKEKLNLLIKYTNEQHT